MASAMSLGGPALSASLADLAFEALSLFQRVQGIESEKTLHDGPAALFTAEAERFELWAVNLGLFVAGHGSLDYRVREADRLAQTIRRFLQELMDSLAEGGTFLSFECSCCIAEKWFNSNPYVYKRRRQANPQ